MVQCEEEDSNRDRQDEQDKEKITLSLLSCSSCLSLFESSQTEPLLTGAINDLESTHSAQQSAKQQAKALTTDLSEKEEILNSTLNQLAAYVESVSGGDEQKIQSAGMDVRAPGTATGALPAPDGLNATQGDMEGEIDLSWDKVDRARSYVIEQSTDPVTATSWQHAAVSTKSQTTIDGLTTGTKYWFRVAAVGPQGQGPWSNLAFKIAP